MSFHEERCVTPRLGRPSIQRGRACSFSRLVIFVLQRAFAVGPESLWEPQSIRGSKIRVQPLFRSCGSEDHLSRKCDLARCPQRSPPLWDMARKQPAISKMTQGAAARGGQPDWSGGSPLACTCEELKATIQEHRMNDPVLRHASTMKSTPNDEDNRQVPGVEFQEIPRQYGM